MEFGQFCPIAKATEILGEKWTILIIRELLMGGSRFNELQQGLGLISPTILSRRLDSLVASGLVMKKKLPGQRRYQYLPTKSCKELLPVITALGDWGTRWAIANIDDKDYDVELLMLYLKRSIVPENLVGEETIIHFHFTDITCHRDWWLIVRRDHVDLCVDNPGKDVDVWFTSSVKTLANIWMGQETYRHAVKSGVLKLVGNRLLTRDVAAWMNNSMFAGLPAASRI